MLVWRVEIISYGREDDCCFTKQNWHPTWLCSPKLQIWICTNYDIEIVKIISNVSTLLKISVQFIFLTPINANVLVCWLLSFYWDTVGSELLITSLSKSRLDIHSWEARYTTRWMNILIYFLFCLLRSYDNKINKHHRGNYLKRNYYYLWWLRIPLLLWIVPYGVLKSLQLVLFLCQWIQSTFSYYIFFTWV